MAEFFAYFACLFNTIISKKVDHYSKSFVEGRRSSLAGYMQELANAPTVDTNPEFLRFVDMTDQFRKLDIKVLMSGDAAETYVSFKFQSIMTALFTYFVSKSLIW